MNLKNLIKRVVPNNILKQRNMFLIRKRFKNSIIDSLYVGRNADIGDNVVIADGCIIQDNCKVGRYIYAI